MTEILTVIPDNKGGQLKFRVDNLSLAHRNDIFDVLKEGILVDVYVHDGIACVFPRSISISLLNTMVLLYGRPKGYGQILWAIDSWNYQVLWTPHIGDEGHFNDK